MFHKILFAVIIGNIACFTSEPSSPSTVNEGTIYGEGIVSDDPPGADDWIEPTDTVDTEAPEEAMAESYVGCSNEIRVWQEPDPLSHPCNFEFIDQNGLKVELYDFEGDVILLDFSTIWCYWCNVAAGHTQTFSDSYTPFTLITVLTEDATGDTVEVDDLQAWVTTHGITSAPVLAGDKNLIGTNPDQWGVSGWPSFFYIDKNFHLRIFQPGWNEETITANIEALIAE
tara:strand:+ start:2855 stop:3538 length:684 start_codon:yes stop_codon:yes gene_type:complete